MKFARAFYVITKAPEQSKWESRVDFIIDWCNKHDVACNIGYMLDGTLACDVAAEGRTTMYCRGVCSEVKEMFRVCFGCKIDSRIYAY